MYLQNISRHANTAARIRRQMARSGTNLAGNKIWTSEEDRLCRSTYPDFAAIAEALPHRTMDAIRWRCKGLGLRIGKVKPFTGREQSEFRRDYQTMEWAMLVAKYSHRSIPAIRTKARDLGIHRPRKALQNTGDELLDAARSECARLKLTMRALDEFSGSKTYFRNCQRQKPNYKHIIRAIRELGGSIKIEWSEE
jgi:hypothetical protein